MQNPTERAPVTIVYNNENTNSTLAALLAILRTFHFTATDAKEIDTSEETALIRKKIEKARE